MRWFRVIVVLMGLGKFTPKLREAALEKMVPNKKRTLIEKNAAESVSMHDFVERLSLIFGVTESPVTGQENIPKDGSLLITANHPFGLKDGVKICLEVLKKRNDVKVLVRDDFVNFNVKGFEDLFLFVDRDKKVNKRENLLQQRELAENFLSEGGALIIFASGLIERKNSEDKFVKQDWKNTFVKMAKKSNASILPVSVGGQLPEIFYILDKLGLTQVSLFLLLRLNFLHKGSVPLHFFDLIDSDKIQNLPTAEFKNFAENIRVLVSGQTEKFNQ